jgi:hypothetical protein
LTRIGRAGGPQLPHAERFRVIVVLRQRAVATGKIFLLAFGIVANLRYGIRRSGLRRRRVSVCRLLRADR